MQSKTFSTLCSMEHLNRAWEDVKAKKAGYGGRINLSVFECMLTDSQLKRLQQEIAGLIDAATDQIAYYTLCVDCFSKILYQPEHKRVREISSTDIF